MIDDARGIRDGSTVSAQVCVVGAGAAGIVIALTLARNGVDVVLLESGGTEFDERTNSLNQGELVGEPMAFLGRDRPIEESRRRFLGGSTNCWFGWCRPMDPMDFEPRPWIGTSGWPIKREEIEPWFSTVADWVGIAHDDFSPATWMGHGMPAPLVDTDRVESAIFQYSLPMRFGEQYRADLETQGRLRLVLWANVIRIDTTPDATVVVGLEVATLEGNRFTVVADMYVLATGGIEVPRLLLASDEAAPNGLGNQSDWVGRSFMEHPYLRAGLVTLTTPPDGIAAYQRQVYAVPDARGASREVAAAMVLRIPDQVQRDRGLTNVYASLETLDPETLDAERDDLVSSAQVAELLRLHGATDVTLARLGISIEQVPQRDSRVRLSTAVDDLGMRRVTVDWRHHPLERATATSMLELLGVELGRLGLGRVAVAPSGVRPEDLSVSVSSHHMGSARMSSAPADGVVDPTCRVHGVDNLFISGSAVFPTVGCSNPTFTLLALALRLADHLGAVS